ncbi:MAG: lysine--tRNA ligase, partial [Firmicutes bacterium]|nr:lysine--tRNA ligase [Bacillota bacterium]
MNLESNGGNDGELSYSQLDSEHVRVRMEKLETLRAKGVDPFGARFERTHLSKEITENFPDLDGSVVRIAGRLMAMRGHGKATFADILDLSGRIQVYAKV